ncbi:MAG TPA: hypothetical protein VN253_28780 [Kofleriaceae bacterium]|nr:hypothetical protein [Kofleriaceae bacterium]
MFVPVIGLVCLLAGSPDASAGEWGFSPGIKVAWSPGNGLTYGVEVSVVRLPDLLEMHTGSLVKDLYHAGIEVITETYGIVFDVDTTFKGLTKLRFGGEWIGPFIGVEAGPSLVFDRKGAHAGLGLTLWAGYEFYPFYTHTFVFGGRDTNELGFYLKTPLLGFGRSHHHHLDFDDDD